MEGRRRFMAAWKKKEVDAAGHRQEKIQTTRLGKLLSHTEAPNFAKRYPLAYVCMYVWSSHIAEYGSTG